MADGSRINPVRREMACRYAAAVAGLTALAALAVMPPAGELVPGGEKGWSAGEAREQISHCIVLLTDEGVQIDAELRRLASRPGA
jgi:hypothetical protein